MSTYLVTNIAGIPIVVDGQQIPTAGSIIIGSIDTNVSNAVASGIVTVTEQVSPVGVQSQGIGLALDGTDATSVTPPTGGVGIRGWLSGIYQALTSSLTISGSVAVSNLPTTQPVSAATLPLPVGAATASGVAAIVTALGSPVQAGVTLVVDQVQYASIVDNVSTSGYVYTCQAPPGTSTSAAAWRISKLNSSTGQTMWANGSAAFNQVAANRTSLTYS